MKPPKTTDKHVKLVKPAPGDGARARAAEIRTLRDRLSKLADESIGARSFTPAVTALSRVATLEAEIRRCETAGRVADTVDIIEQLELMRAQALEDGSMAAASTLTDQLRTAQEDRRLAEERAREEQAKAADPALMRAHLAEALRLLPPDEATRLREELGWI